MGKLLDVKDLSVCFHTDAGWVPAVNGISFTVDTGEAVGIVGESGSGKSAAMLSIMKLLPDNGRMEAGSMKFAGQDLKHFSREQMQDIRGKDIGMIFQDPMTSLNPAFTIGNQLIEAIRRHNRIPRAEAVKKAIDMLKIVGIPGPEKRLGQYPFQFSGGMRQRVMIAMALSCGPRLLIADEPTTALDATIQAQVMELIKELKERLGMAMILITHHLGLVADICERVVIMYGGVLVEQGRVDDIFYRPAHPYTRGLLRAIPRAGMEKQRLTPIEGQPAGTAMPTAGCPFVWRCSHAMEICNQRMPEHIELEAGHSSACWLDCRDGKGAGA